MWKDSSCIFEEICFCYTSDRRKIISICSPQLEHGKVIIACSVTKLLKGAGGRRGVAAGLHLQGFPAWMICWQTSCRLTQKRSWLNRQDVRQQKPPLATPRPATRTDNKTTSYPSSGHSNGSVQLAEKNFARILSLPIDGDSGTPRLLVPRGISVAAMCRFVKPRRGCFSNRSGTLWGFQESSSLDRMPDEDDDFAGNLTGQPERIGPGNVPSCAAGAVPTRCRLFAFSGCLFTLDPFCGDDRLDDLFKLFVSPP